MLIAYASEGRTWLHAVLAAEPGRTAALSIVLLAFGILATGESWQETIEATYVSRYTVVIPHWIVAGAEIAHTMEDNHPDGHPSRHYVPGSSQCR